MSRCSSGRVGRAPPTVVGFTGGPDGAPHLGQRVVLGSRAECTAALRGHRRRAARPCRWPVRPDRRGPRPGRGVCPADQMDDAQLVVLASEVDDALAAPREWGGTKRTRGAWARGAAVAALVAAAAPIVLYARLG